MKANRPLTASVAVAVMISCQGPLAFGDQVAPPAVVTPPPAGQPLPAAPIAPAPALPAAPAANDPGTVAPAGDDTRDCEDGACDSDNPDADMVVAPGPLNGDWLVRLQTDNGKDGPLLLRLSLLHAEDAPRATGLFSGEAALCTGIAVLAKDCPYDGVQGQITDAVVEVDKVVIHFNPSPDVADEESLTLDRSDQQGWTGTLEGEGRSLAVVMRPAG